MQAAGRRVALHFSLLAPVSKDPMRGIKALEQCFCTFDVINAMLTHRCRLNFHSHSPRALSFYICINLAAALIRAQVEQWRSAVWTVGEACACPLGFFQAFHGSAGRVFALDSLLCASTACIRPGTLLRAFISVTSSQLHALHAEDHLELGLHAEQLQKCLLRELCTRACIHARSLCR